MFAGCWQIMRVYSHLIRVERIGYWQLIQAEKEAVCRSCDLCLQAVTDKAVKEILALLILHVADINHQGRYGKTALHYACGSRELFPAQILTENGAVPTIKDEDDRTPLCLAKKNNKCRAIEKFLVSYIENNLLTSQITVTVDEPENLFM